MIYIYMFFQSCYAIFFGICYNSSPFFCSWITRDKTYMTNHTPHDLKFVSMNNVIIIYNEKWPTQCIPIMPSPFFSCKCNFYKFVLVFSSSL